jgi:hypothetical protein
MHNTACQLAATAEAQVSLASGMLIAMSTPVLAWVWQQQHDLLHIQAVCCTALQVAVAEQQ